MALETGEDEFASWSGCTPDTEGLQVITPTASRKKVSLERHVQEAYWRRAGKARLR